MTALSKVSQLVSIGFERKAQSTLLASSLLKMAASLFQRTTKGLIILSLLTAGYSFAETYTFPEDGDTGLFSTCTVSGNSIDCPGSITLSNNNFDDIVLTEAVTLTIGGSLSIGNNADINLANNVSFDILVGGNVFIGNNATVNASISADGNIDFGNNASIEGDLEADGNIQIGNNSNVEGDCTASGGNYPSYCTGAIPSPFAEYRLDELSWSGLSGEVLDRSGNGRHGTSFGSSQTIDLGQICNAGQFNGTTDYIETPDLSPLQGTATLSFWIRTTVSGSNTGWQAPAVAGVEQSGGVDDIFWGWIDASGRIGITKGNDFNATKSNASINNGTFRHVVLTRNASNGAFQIFIDGSLDRSGTLNNQIGSVSNPFNDIARVQYTNGSGANFLQADLDEIVIFEQVLSSGQVSKLYQRQLAQRNLDGTVRDCPTQTCFSDDFDSGTLSDDWVTSVSRGSFTPGIVNVNGSNRLRMTEAQDNQSTAATLQRLIPAANNLVILEFDYYAYGGDGADGLAIVLSDAAITPQPGSFGGSLGYAQRNNGDPGFAGGWLGIGLDEYGNFAADTEGRVGGSTRTLNSISIRGSGSGTDGYRYLTGTDTLSPGIDSTTSTDPHKYRIIVDSRTANTAIISVDRDTSGTGTNYTTLIGPYDVLSDANQAVVPDNFLLSLTGSTGGSNNVHEFGNFTICADQINPIGDQLDHFELIHSGSGITCQPEDIIVRACLNADCSTLFNDEVTVELMPDGWEGSNTITFSGGSTTVPFQSTAAGSVTLGVVSSTPTTRPFTETQCIAGGSGPDTSLCDLAFFNSGLAFILPDQLANKPSEDIRVAAVDTDTETLQCVPAFGDVSRDVQFWSSYVDPGSSGRPVSWPISVNNQEIGQDETSATSLTLDFDSNGEALIDVHYADAGLMQLDARYLGRAANNDDGLVMPGNDIFVSYPAGFVVTPENGCTTADSNCTNSWVSGTDFGTTVTAKAWQADGDSDFSDNDPTPNFQLNNLALEHTLRAPASGEKGVATLTSYNHSTAANGQNQLTQRLSEVGVFDFTLTPPSYYGINLGATLSSLSARMIPADFDLVQTPGAFNASCDLSTLIAYSGQTLGWLTRPELQISAVNAEGNLTQNYTLGGFNKLQTSSLNRIAPINDSSALNALGQPFPLSLTLNEGQLDIVNPGTQRYRFSPSDSLVYSKTTDSRVSPFMPRVAINLSALTDNDLVSASTLPANLIPTANFELRYGRIRLENAYGPETRDLIVPMRAEYFDGATMALNEAESCWIYRDTDASLTPAITSLVAVTDTLLTGEVKPGSELVLEAPGAGNTGSARLTMNVPVWLQDDFNGDGALDLPEAAVTFGVYRGHDRIIYWREIEP